MSKLAVAGGIFAVLAIGGAITGNSGSAGSGSDGVDKSYCHDAVRDQLRSPATAHFHDEIVDKSNPGDDYEFSVAGNVDSENGYGALLTSTFVCHTYSTGVMAGDPVVIGG